MQTNGIKAAAATATNPQRGCCLGVQLDLVAVLLHVGLLVLVALRVVGLPGIHLRLVLVVVVLSPVGARDVKMNRALRRSSVG